MNQLGRLLPLLAGFLALLVGYGALLGVSSALAAWQPPGTLGPAVRLPVIGFDPAGDAALAWGSSDAQPDDAVDVIRHPYGGSFGAATAFPSFGPIGAPLPAATDASGDTFLANIATNCGDERRDAQDAAVAVAARPPLGAFAVHRVLPCQPLSTANPLPQISAAGDGRAVLLSVTGVPRKYALVVQIRTHGRFGSPHVLLRSKGDPQPLGPAAIGLGGGITAAGETCRPFEDGHCVTTVAHGSLNGGPWRTQTVAGVAEVGDGYAVLSHCAKQVCRLSVSLVGRDGHLGAPRTITADGQLIYADQLAEASSGRRRERAIVWISPQGGIFAVVADPGQTHFGAVRRLAPDGATSVGSVAYETGPRDQVIVAWLSRDGTADATVYSP